MSQSPFYPGDTLYVWAKSGLNMRESNSKESKKISAIPFGAQVVALEYSSGIEYSVVISKRRTLFENTNHPVKAPEFAIRGNWLKVKFDNREGYVSDIYLSSLPVPKVEFFEQVMQQTGKSLEFVELKETPREYLGRIFGQNKVIETNKTMNPESVTTLVLYKNGASYRREIWGSAGAVETIIIPEINMNEGYLLFNLMFNYEVHASNQTYKEIYPLEVEELTWRFNTGEPEGETTLTKVGGFFIMTWFYHC